MFWFKKRPTEAASEPASSEAELADVIGAEPVEEAKPRHTFRRAAAMLALCAMFFASAGAHAVLAADTGSSSGIDMGLAKDMVDLIKAVNTLFTVSPINYFLVGTLVLLAFKIFRSAKKTAAPN